jgi:hypothetical protein
MALEKYLGDSHWVEFYSEGNKRCALIYKKLFWSYGSIGEPDEYRDHPIVVLTARTNRGIHKKVERWWAKKERQLAALRGKDTPLEPGVTSVKRDGGTFVDMDFSGDYEERNPDLQFRRDQLRKFREEGGKEVPATVKVFRSNETNQFMIAVNFHPGDSHASLDVNLFVSEETVEDASKRDLAVSVPAIIERIG